MRLLRCGRRRVRASRDVIVVDLGCVSTLSNGGCWMRTHCAVRRLVVFDSRSRQLLGRMLEGVAEESLG